MTAPVMVTLATGEAVSNCSDEWRQECYARWQKVVSLRPLSLEARRAALAEVEQQQGALARQRLEDEFRKDWTARKAVTT